MMSSVYTYASSLTNEIKCHGNHDQNRTHLILKAGCLSMVYENGTIRYISIGAREVIRMIYSAVRGKEWLTVPPVISEEEFDIRPESFRITYRCQFKSGEINFSARFTIVGNQDSSLFFILEGEALENFEKNRIGFCVLHPVEGYAGESCIIRHSNDDQETSEFPRFISPKQIFIDIKSMKWKVSDLNCTIDFYGDIFETEDQRNWTDASYKTYSTPLNRPFPVKLQKGERISQKIDLKVEGDFVQKKSDNGQIITTIYPENIYEIPMMGIARSTRPEPLTVAEIQNLKYLRFDHYRIELLLFNTDWKNRAELAVNEAGMLEYPIEFALFFDDNYVIQSTDFITWISGKQSTIACINLYHKTEKSTPDLLTDTVTPLFREALPGVEIGCGTNSNFAQLNSTRPESVLNDNICYSVQPQEHASDDTTLIENLQAQAYTADSARQFANGRKLWISPVNIQRRFNANITNYEQLYAGVDLPPQVDCRLMSLFGACWTAGSLKYLCEEGIKGVTYFETVGERGIMQGESDSRWPENFFSVKGMFFPVYHILFFLLKHKSLKVIKSRSSHPLAVDILILTDGEIVKMIVINFTPYRQKADINGFNELNTICQLNSKTFADAVSDPFWIEKAQKVLITPDRNFIFEPFSVSFIDGRV